MKTPYSLWLRSLHFAVAFSLITAAAHATPPAATRIGDYQTAGSGPLTSISTWEVFVAGPSGTAADGSFVPATAVPTNADGTITIRASHTITLATAATLDELFIEYGGTLEHSGVSNLTITTSPAPYNLVVQGTYRELSTSGRVIAAPGAGIVIDETGIWRHSANGGTIPTALWSPSSLLLFDGITTATTLASTARLGQEFGRITWDCPLQTSTFALGPLSTETNAVSTVAAGDMIVTSTGAGTLQLASNSKINPVRIGSSFEQFAGRVTVNATANGPRTLSVGGDFTLHGGTFVVTRASAPATPLATGALTVTGGINLLGGTLNITQFNRPGSISVTGGVGLAAGSQLRATGSAAATFNFAQGPSRLYTNLGTVSGSIFFNVNGGSTVDFGIYALFGTGTFTLSDGAVARIGSPDGITAAGQPDALLGNVRVGTTPFQRTYSPLGYYIYTGTQPQRTGTGLPLGIGAATATLNAGGIAITTSAPTNTVTLSRPLRLNGELQLEMGQLISSSTAKLTLGPTGFLNVSNSGSDDSHVEGVMAREMDDTQTLYVYPVGDMGDYRPIEMRLTDPSGTATYDITASRAPAPNSTQLAGEGAMHIETLLGDTHWPIARTAGTTTGIIRIPFTPGITTDLLKLTVAGYNPGTAKWENLGLVARDLVNNWVEATVPPQYTMVSLARAGENPLPVELTRFAAVRRAGVVELTWATASEQNSAYFAVERSAAGRDFTEVTRVTAAGNSVIEQRYATTDAKPLTQTSYYRLRQVDRDGRIAYSDIVAVRGGAGPVEPVSVYPNPTVDACTVHLPSIGGGTMVSVVNMLGQVVLTQTPEATASECHLNLTALPAGTYLVTVATPGQPSVSQRLVKSAQ